MLFVINPFPYYTDNKLSKKVLLIGGRIGSGKSFIAHELNKLFQWPVFHFASRVKDIAKQSGWDGKTKDDAARKLLQYIGGYGRLSSKGTKWARDVALSVYNSNSLVSVVDDFRYPEEYYFLSKFFEVYTMWVDADFQSDSYKYNYYKTMKHESELASQYFKLWNFVFYNKGEEDLEIELEKLGNLIGGIK